MDLCWKRPRSYTPSMSNDVDSDKAHDIFVYKHRQTLTL